MDKFEKNIKNDKMSKIRETDKFSKNKKKMTKSPKIGKKLKIDSKAQNIKKLW